MKTKTRYDKKINKIVKDITVLEEITFQGETIIRENIVKEWNIPNIITEDIGYQLMFGNSPSIARHHLNCGVEEVHLNPQYYEGKH